MTLLTMPASPAIATIEWDIDTPSQANRSEFTGARSVLLLNKAPRWSATLNLVTAIGEPEMKPWRAFLQRCKGVSGKFKLPATETPQTTALGLIRVDGAGQEGFALATKGWFPNSYLVEGDFITVGDQLIGVDRTIRAGADGKAVIPLLQYLRKWPADNALVEARDPYAVMSLPKSNTGWKVMQGQQYATQIPCEESY